MKLVHMGAFALVVVGGLNWLLVGAIGWDIGQLFGGQSAMISRIIYVLVGLSAIYLGATHMKDCKQCSEGGMGMKSSGMPGMGGNKGV